MAQREAEEERIRNQRYFDSTAKTTFVAQDLTMNQVGRLVMKTQDGAMISSNKRDELLLVEHGYGRRLQKQPDNEIWQKVPKGDYTQTQPVTIYTQALENKTQYMSGATGVNAFARTSGFTQPINQTRSAVGFEGNVDYEREKKNIEFMRTTGHDLNAGNPYQNKELEMENFENIKARVIEVCKQRSGNGIRGLRVMFKQMDNNRNGSLDPVEFKYGMRDYGIDITEKELTAILKHFDTNRDGKLSFDEFLRAISGDLNQRRLDMVHQAYAVLDKDGSGLVTIADIEIAYDVSQHPDFQSGRKSAQEVLLEFMSVWETRKRDGIVTVEEFEDYYKDMSASIDSDDYFELMIRNA